MKRIFTLMLALIVLSFGKSFSQSNCVVLGCAANHGTQNAEGSTIGATTVAAGEAPGSCYNGATYQQLYWQFFYSPNGGVYKQAFSPIVGGDALDLDYAVLDMGTSIPLPASISCPIVDVTPWTELVCNNNPSFDVPTGPGEPFSFGDLVTTVAGHYYAVAISSWQSLDATYDFDVGTPTIDEGLGAGDQPLTAANCISLIFLPVKLSSFTARVNNCLVNLNWVSESESNFKNYEIQFSTNGKDFATVGTVNSGNPGGGQKYSYQHKPQQGKVYYRIKMVDNDNKAEYSKTIAMKLDCSKRQVFVYPNPVTDILNVNITNSQNGFTVARIFDTNGKMIYSGKMLSGTNTVNTRSFPKGIYLLKLTDGSEIQNIKIIK